LDNDRLGLRESNIDLFVVQDSRVEYPEEGFMFPFRLMVLAPLVALVGSGCGGSNVAEMTAEIEKLKSQVAELESRSATLEAQLTAAQADLARVDEIRQGYETARTEFQKNLAQLAPVLGLTGPLLPPFEQLKDSSWVGRLAPTPEVTSGLKDLEQQFRGLLDAMGDQPGGNLRPKD
jgi:outer membrane murein-binding lipoprotein Lpp